jgi:hypothetical protein
MGRPHGCATTELVFDHPAEAVTAERALLLGVCTDLMQLVFCHIAAE